MTAAQLLDHLSGFESLVARPSGQIVAALQPYTALLSSVGRYVILMLFVFGMLRKATGNRLDELKRTLVAESVVLILVMALFGTEKGCSFVTYHCMAVYNVFGSGLFGAEMFQFKGSMRSFLDALAESGNHGVDFFNVKAMTATVLAFAFSAVLYVLLATYYIFASIGTFYLLVALAAGPIMAGFLFFMKRPFYNWVYLVIASILFPFFSGLALCVLNATSLVPGLEKSLAAGSIMACLIQGVLAIGFMQLVIVFHAAIFGVGFLNVPVKIMSIFQGLHGMLHSPVLNFGIMIANRKRG